ncbi:hypothetical protein BDV97DRAFT_365988 [Delphinella strobiligena]|nr:hypothetical protein BDV97DRAFT_365988 [Delphinella strobiligena]
MAARSRLPLIATLALGGAGGYYLYNAGGRPKVAEKQFEHDAARLSSKVRSEFPGKEKEVKTEAKLYGEQAKQYGEQIGDKVDETLASAKAKSKEYETQLQAKTAEAEKALEKYRKDAGKELNAAVDKFDKTVEDGVSKTKSGISSWFK